MQEVVIYGAGGHAREIFQFVLDMARAGASIRCAGFLLDEGFAKPILPPPCPPILGDHRWLHGHPDVGVVVGIGDPAARHRIVRMLEQEIRPTFPTLVHPRAYFGERVSTGPGGVFFPGVRVTTDVSIGAHVHVNLNSTISHDSRVHDFATLSPGVNIPGHVRIGEGAEIGTGAVVIPRTSVGAWSIVGAGAVVLKDVPDNVTVVGVPARTVAERMQGWHLRTDQSLSK
jgi:sugar O-acyltransferase (sialic acid O-acetyltransferase NeuD family)